MVWASRTLILSLFVLGCSSDGTSPDQGASIDLGVDRGPTDTGVDGAPAKDATPSTDSSAELGSDGMRRDLGPSPDLQLDFGVGDPCQGVTAVAGKPPLKATVISSSSWRRLVDLAFMPGDPTRIFVVEQHAGRVQVVLGGQAQAQPALDIGDRLSTGSEQGLLSIAFHPGYATNRKLYLYYTDKSRAVQVREFKTKVGNPNSIDVASEREILTVPQPEGNHNGGALRFGPDGYLYISVGDGGGAGDRHGTIGNGQTKDTWLGKILRIDIDKQAGGKPYAVPSDNPFVNDADFLPEIYHWGLRNPFRFSFDRKTGAMWIADVGQNAWEEIDYVAPGESGKNFGWRCREGLVGYNMNGPACNSATFTDPVLVQPTTGSFCSMIVGYPYRGCRMPGYGGVVFYSDYCADNPRLFSFDGTTVSGEQAITTIDANPVAWAEDHQGELYFVRLGSKVYRLDPS